MVLRPADMVCRLAVVLLLQALLPYSLLRAELSLPAERCGFTRVLQQHIADKRSENNVVADQRPSLPEYIESSSALVRVHFSRTGTDAVPLADVDNSGIPDYVEECVRAIEDSYAAYVSMGYAQPPNDGEAGGSGAIDVYLHDLSKAGNGGTGLYGNTVPEARTSSGPPERFTAWMEFDNDFAESDRNVNGNPIYATHGVDALRVTCAHELHHVFQVGSYGVVNVQLMVYEFSSTWMEQRLYPQIPDWPTYSANLFTTPSGYPLSEAAGQNGYVWAFFNRTLQNLGSDRLLVRVWERIGANEQPMSSVVNACHDVGTSLSAAMCSNLAMFYHTGSRDIESDALYFGELLPEIALWADEQANAPLEMSTGDLRAFEIRAFRYAVPPLSGSNQISTAVVITWPNEDAFTRANASERIPFRVTVISNPLPSDVPIVGSNWAVRIEPPELCAWIDGSASEHITSPYPHPVQLSHSKDVFIPVPLAKYLDQVELTVLTTEFVVKQHEVVQVALDDMRLVAPLHLADDVVPGTYIVRCTVHNQTTLSKLVVQR